MSFVSLGDVQAGARFGAAPWQVGVLAALLLVFEIFVGAHSVEALQAKALQVTSQHLQRAYAVSPSRPLADSNNFSCSCGYVLLL